MTRVTVAVLLTIALAALAQPTTKPYSPASAAFDRLKAMEGTWEGKSTKGWTERATFSLIAGGTCVLETTEMLHGEGKTPTKMATAYHMDGSDLMLTHYCVAKNQPRMKATEISSDGKEILFTFVDATNLTSRDVGHMDKAHVQFVDDNTVRAKWTWYQDGKEKWMEEIELKRIGK